MSLHLAAARREQPAAPSTSSRQATALRRAVHGLWTGLPTLLLAGVAIVAAVAASVLLGGGLTPWTLLFAAALAGPPVLATAAAANDLVVEQDASPSAWLQAWRTYAWRGVRVWLVPAAFGVLLQIAALMLYGTGGLAAAISTAVCAAVTAVAVTAALAASALWPARPELGWTQVWLTAGHLVARWPVRFLAPLCLLGLGLWAGLMLTGTLLVLVPGPVMMLTAAAFWACAVQRGAGDLDPERTDS